MSRHPAPDELLLDYATGALAEGPALAVSLHVALDPAARRAVDRLRALGGTLLEEEVAPEFGEAALSDIMARLEGVAVEPRGTPASTPRPGFEWAPAPLLPYLGHKDRKRAVGGLGRDE